jgi:hypothetical protein
MASDEQIRELVEKLHAERARLLATLSGMSEAQAEHRPPDKDGEEGWSVKEILVHLAWQDATYRRWVERAVAESGATIDYQPVTVLGVAAGAGHAPETAGAGAAVAHYLELAHRHTLRELIAELERQRARTMLLIADLAPADFDRTARTAIFGELTVLQYLRSNYRHERQHRAQILGEPSEYRPRYLSGVEPDQRIRRRADG